MFSLHTSVGRVWRLLLSAILVFGAAVTQAGTPIPQLATLELQSGTGPIGFAPATLSPPFDPDTTEYSISIPFEHSQIQISSISTVDPFHDSLEPMFPTFLPGQSTPFTITVVDDLFLPDQTTDYTIHVTRGPSNNVAVLSNLVVSGTSLSPSFGQLTFGYTGSVPNETTSFTVTPTAQAGTSSIKVNNQSASSGLPFGPIDLDEGANEIIVKVKDGNVTKAYVIDITRLPPTADTDMDGMPDDYENANGLAFDVDDAGLDLDGDGLSNLGEYAFGSDPDDITEHNDPVVSRNAGGFLVITFQRAIDPEDGSYEVQVSSDLEIWTSEVDDDTNSSTPETQVWRDTNGGSPPAPATRFIRIIFTPTL